MSLKSYHNLLYKAWVGPFCPPSPPQTKGFQKHYNNKECAIYMPVDVVLLISFHHHNNLMIYQC